MQSARSIISVRYAFKAKCKINFSVRCFFSAICTLIYRCCNNCPRDHCPRRQLSKGLLSHDIVVKASFCPRKRLRLLVKNLLKLIFLFSIDTYQQVCYKVEKIIWAAFPSSNRFHGQKCPWTNVRLENCPLDKSPFDNSLLGLWSARFVKVYRSHELCRNVGSHNSCGNASGIIHACKGRGNALCHFLNIV